MGQAFYRTYRSKSLSEVVGQEHITETLVNSLKNGRISHAYLFTGPRGVGKTSVARILAHEINGLPYSEGQQLDIIEIDAASNRRIDDIRDLRDKVHIAPAASKYKVYIIDEVHMLTGESFNALLKTLEEPPSHVVFILATTEVHKLPATIISRVQQYAFRPVPIAKVIGHLRFIAQQEQLTVEDAALALIAEHGEGSFRDSISLLDQLANVSGGTITAQIVEQSLGLAPRAALDALLIALQHKDHAGLIAQLTALEQQGATTTALVPQLLRALQTAAQQQPDFYLLLDKLLEVPRAYNPQIKLLATLVSYIIGPAPSSKEQPAKHRPTIAQTEKPILELTIPTNQPLPNVKQTKQPDRGTPPVPPVATDAPTTALSELTNEQWAQTLAKVKSASAPLASILRQALTAFDHEKQLLTLTFKYPLHRKRAEDSKAKNILAEALLAVTGCRAGIATSIDSTIEPPNILVPAVPDDTTNPAVQSLMELMGGGQTL